MLNKEYCTALLDRLNDKIKKRHPPLSKKKKLFYQDNATQNNVTMKFIDELKCSLDLISSDYCLL